MYYEALFELNNFLLEEEIKWNNLENSLILTEASIVLNEEEEIENNELADKVESGNLCLKEIADAAGNACVASKLDLLNAKNNL